MTPPWSSQSQCNEHYGWLVALLVLLAGASWLRAIDRLSRVENQLPRPVSRCLMPTSLPPLPETGKFEQCGYSRGTPDKAADPAETESPLFYQRVEAYPRWGPASLLIHSLAGRRISRS
jgi:hypothetical protein